MKRKPTFTTIECKPPYRPPAPPPEVRYGRRVRRDTTADRYLYQDQGCDVSPSCLRCPLERCVYDAPRAKRPSALEPLDDALRRRRSEGATVRSLAKEFGMSRRSVFRSLARTRGE
jgi:hypothetical protein